MAHDSSDPALAVASKRVVDLQAELVATRKGMLHQFTLAGKLTKSVFAIDKDYFGGRFQDKEDQDNPDPFRDLALATKVVEAVSEELQGTSAFADSPVLRDGIANLIAALESARGTATEMDKSGLDAVGLPVRLEGMKTRVFPENNPPGCLAEAASSVHDLNAMMARTRDRFSAMRMMMNEAERARSEAESSVTLVNVDKIAIDVTNELKAVQQDLKLTRSQLMSTVDSHSQTLKSLRTELDRARRDATSEGDLRQADRAEARSLAAEIARQVELSMPAGSGDDLDITLSVLREALNDDQDMASLAAATEAVVVDWARLAGQQKANTAVIGATATAVDDGRLASLEKNLAAARLAAAEAQQLTVRLAEAERRAAFSDQELARHQKEQNEKSAQPGSTNAASAAAEASALKTKLTEVESVLAARERELKQAKDLAAAAQQQTELTSKSAQQGMDVTGRDITALRAQLSQATTTLRLKEDEAKRTREALQQEQTKNVDVAQNLTRQFHAAQEKLAVSTSELQSVRAQATDLSKQLADTVLRSAQSRDAEIKHVREVQARELKQAIDAKVIAETKWQQIEATAKHNEAQRSSDLSEARKTISALETRVSEQHIKLDTTGADSARLKSELGRMTGEHTKAMANLEFATARERQLGVDRERIERERVELQARLEALRKTSDATLTQGEQNLGTLKKQLTEAKAAEEALRTQLNLLTTESAALGERRGKADNELATLRSEKERVAASLHSVTQERDQARLTLSEIERERARQIETQGRAELHVRTLTSDVAQLKRSEQEATVQAEKLSVELAQLRERLLASQHVGAQASAQQSALKDQEAKVIGERDAARTAMANTVAERDRLKAQADRLQNDHDALAKRLDERETQLNARLSESSRQLGELKQANTRLAAESERIQAEAARTASARSEAKDAVERKDSTSTWTKRLTESSAAVDQARARTNELERKFEELRSHLAQAEERTARQNQGEVHLRERVGEVERREVMLQQQLASAKSEADQARTRLTTVERDLATAKTTLEDTDARRERQKVRFDALMREARDAVASAAKRQSHMEDADKEIISDLLKQVQDLRLRTGTNG